MEGSVRRGFARDQLEQRLNAMEHAFFVDSTDGNAVFGNIEDVVRAQVGVDIQQKGKTLVVRCLAFGEVDDHGMVTVFFEINGQPRRIKVPDRAHGAAGSAARRKADPANAAHVGAPMPGVISTVAITAGQSVKAGDVLVSIEAMKMETALHADRDGTISEVLVKAGDQIDAKDLLVVFSA